MRHEPERERKECAFVVKTIRSDYHYIYEEAKRGGAHVKTDEALRFAL